MKRSEMKNHIYETLLNLSLDDEYSLSIVKLLSEEILKTIESKGMLPPEIPTYTKYGTLWNYSSEWEKE